MAHHSSGPMVLMMPGISLMEVRQLADGSAHIRCPGCGATQVLAARSAGAFLEAFLHEDDCPVLAQIEAALARLDAAQTAVKH